MPFLFALTLFTLLDVIVLFSVGGQIGLPTTLLLVLGTAFIGLQLIRREGVTTFARARARLELGELPAGELLAGTALVVGGVLLIAPGFLSDVLGLLCLAPNARRLLGKLLARLGLHAPGLHARTEAFTSASDPGDDWAQASAAHRRYTASDAPRQRASDAPLEGDFISRNEQR